MTSKDALKQIKKIGDYIAQSNAWDIRDELYKCCDTLEKDLELLDCFLNCFKSSILEATDSQNRRGDNILADTLKDELGLITLNKLKERLKNE